MHTDRRRQLLKRLDTAWVAFNASYAGLSDVEIRAPGVTGDWSVRDILAHVTTWEEEALEHLPLILRGGTPPRYSVRYGGIDAFNARTTAQKRGLSLSEVHTELAATHGRLVDFIQSAPADQLVGGTRFRRRLRLDTYGHYPLHAEAIRQWRRRMSHEARTYTLLGPDRRPYPSATPGALGGYRPGRVYGRLDCPAALRAIARGGYVRHRVFFADEPTAVAAGYRPCAVCLPDAHAAWKARGLWY